MTLKTMSNEEDTAKADSDAKSGYVGIGASVALDRSSTTHRPVAAIQDGATVSGGNGADDLRGSLTTRRDRGQGRLGRRHLAISPSVSIGIADNVMTATIGTGAAHDGDGRRDDHGERGRSIEPRLQCLGRR